MLQSFMWMTHFPVYRYRILEETFGFFDLPYPDPGAIVDSMLKKNGHGTGINPYFAGLQIDN